MIYHVVPQENSWPPDEFLASWAPALRDRFKSIQVQDLSKHSALPLGTYIFSDIERQTSWQKELQAQLADQLLAAGCKVLNHPAKVHCRFQLLTELQNRGANSYRVFDASSLPQDLRFPVFLRMDNDHNGNCSPLLYGWDELNFGLSHMGLSGTPLENLMIVEFCDTVDTAGMYRKYSVFRFGPTYVPRHLIFGHEWSLKLPNADYMPPAHVEEEREFMEVFAHKDQIVEVFELACIDFGRIDYAMKEGRVQVWEINTNPVITMHPDDYLPQHMPAQYWFAERAEKAITALDLDLYGSVPIRFKPY